MLPPLLPCKGAISLTPMTTELVDGSFISVVVGFCIAISVTTSPALEEISTWYMHIFPQQLVGGDRPAFLSLLSICFYSTVSRSFLFGCKVRVLLHFGHWAYFGLEPKQTHLWPHRHCNLRPVFCIVTCSN
jgi:hypothetical protein